MTGNSRGIDIGDIHHVAMVVENLDQGMDLYAELFGLTWANPWTGPIPILYKGESEEPIISFTLSREGPPHIELIQSTLHEVWQPTAGLHHIGFWKSQIEPAVKSPLELGFAVEVMSPTGDFVYLRSQDGSRIEFVAASSQPDFERWLEGGQL